MPQRYSAEYVQERMRGPFPGRVDPWAEVGRYFHQIHGSMITFLQEQIQSQVYELGYLVGREATLQVFAQRQPDLFVERGATNKEDQRPDYDALAATLQLPVAMRLSTDENELDALWVYRADDEQLVTVVEIISPRNKTHLAEMEKYMLQRADVFLRRGVNVVEIDATRSHKRLLSHPVVREMAYHTVIFLPDDDPRVLLSEYHQPLKPFALPLTNEVVRVDPQPAYDRAYQQGAIAAFLLNQHGYVADELPFPSTLTDQQQGALLRAVEAWKKRLEELRHSTGADSSD